MYNAEYVQCTSNKTAFNKTYARFTLKCHNLSAEIEHLGPKSYVASTGSILNTLCLDLFNFCHHILISWLRKSTHSEKVPTEVLWLMSNPKTKAQPRWQRTKQIGCLGEQRASNQRGVVLSVFLFSHITSLCLYNITPHWLGVPWEYIYLKNWISWHAQDDGCTCQATGTS